jgi:hypothetical protein
MNETTFQARLLEDPADPDGEWTPIIESSLSHAGCEAVLERESVQKCLEAAIELMEEDIDDSGKKFIADDYNRLAIVRVSTCHIPITRENIENERKLARERLGIPG